MGQQGKGGAMNIQTFLQICIRDGYRVFLIAAQVITRLLPIYSSLGISILLNFYCILSF